MSNSKRPFFRYTSKELIAEFEKWMDVENTRTALFSWGDFDRRQFVKDAQLHELDLTWLKYWACLQSHYSNFKGSSNQIGLKNALKLEGLEFDGVQHRAIEDARNMAELFKQVAKPLGIV